MTQDPDNYVSLLSDEAEERDLVHCGGNWSFKQKTSPSFFIMFTCLSAKKKTVSKQTGFKEMYVNYHQCSRNGAGLPCCRHLTNIKHNSRLCSKLVL